MESGFKIKGRGLGSNNALKVRSFIQPENPPGQTVTGSIGWTVVKQMMS